MLVENFYDAEKAIDEVWYSSSNVAYSKYDENTGNLDVTFNNGAQYRYLGVNVDKDYMLFKHGGLEGSQGKELNRTIKPKYEFIKLDPQPMEALLERKKMLTDQREKRRILKLTYFISGHRDITEEEFAASYAPALRKVVMDGEEGLNFLVGDYQGADIMAQNFLIDEIGVPEDMITVYHCGDKPMNANPKIKKFKGGFQNDEERDSAMTRASGHDIAFVRDCYKWSGTGTNILRRHLMPNLRTGSIY